MRCPQCRKQLLEIEVCFRGVVTAFFHDDENYELTQPVKLRSRWEEDSRCFCGSCNWEGVVGEALAAPQWAAREAG